MVGKTESDIRLELGLDTINIRVLSASFTGGSSNARIHRPRAGLPQTLVGHRTGGTLTVSCYVDRNEFDKVLAMLGESVVIRFASGGDAVGVLTSAQAAAEPASWGTEEPYVEVGLVVMTRSETVSNQ